MFLPLVKQLFAHSFKEGRLRTYCVPGIGKAPSLPSWNGHLSGVTGSSKKVTKKHQKYLVGLSDTGKEKSGLGKLAPLEREISAQA